VSSVLANALRVKTALKQKIKKDRNIVFFILLSPENVKGATGKLIF
jgi:hypothetical protein